MGQSHGSYASACRHRNREMLNLRHQSRGDKRHRLQQRREQKFDSDDDEDGIWQAWGGPNELTLANGQPFSSGTEGDQNGKEFEDTIRQLFSLDSTHIQLHQGGLAEDVADRLRKAHSRLPRDLATVECDYNIGREKFVLAQLDGVGSLSPSQLEMGEWLLEPEKKEGMCIAEFCINSKPFSAKLYQLGRIAEMIHAGAECADDHDIKNHHIIYLIIVDRSRPNLAPSRLLRRYKALNLAYKHGRFGVLYVSMGTLARKWAQGRWNAPRRGCSPLCLLFLLSVWVRDLCLPADYHHMLLSVHVIVSWRRLAACVHVWPHRSGMQNNFLTTPLKVPFRTSFEYMQVTIPI